MWFLLRFISWGHTQHLSLYFVTNMHISHNTDTVRRMKLKLYQRVHHARLFICLFDCLFVYLLKFYDRRANFPKFYRQACSQPPPTRKQGPLSRVPCMFTSDYVPPERSFKSFLMEHLIALWVSHSGFEPFNFNAFLKVVFGNPTKLGSPSKRKVNLTMKYRGSDWQNVHISGGF